MRHVLSAFSTRVHCFPSQCFLTRGFTPIRLLNKHNTENGFHKTKEKRENQLYLYSSPKTLKRTYVTILSSLLYPARDKPCLRCLYCDIICCNIQIQIPQLANITSSTSCYFLDTHKHMYICTVSKDSSYT
jgi:hypothetical protein